ncbi:DUF2231 domain-containing protein [Paenibacillus sp. RC67]|uniref:DUF2231 domain-containing protein n=1 Tax=Paenibacillus sp. RC67 TaxID=3039392 RepID=UPI0024ADBABE|nr:DUF2231 domain-containing protein [Paenibacillus sp. RC67]
MNTPLHPLIVHFPIALLILGTVLLWLSFWKKAWLDKAAIIMLSIGWFSGVAAYMTGDGGEEFALSHFGATRPMIHQHENMAMYSMILFAIVVGINIISRFVSIRYIRIIEILASITGLVFIVLTGHYGGQLVYHN